MSKSTNNESAGRGARKRDDAKVQRERDEALRFWTRPGTLIFLAAVVLAGLGWALVIQASRRIPVEQAEIGGLHLQLSQARWILDQMDHGENFEKPSVMMPDMPEWGKQRVTMELAFRNDSEYGQIYDGSEFFLVPEYGDDLPPIGAQVGRAEIGPGQTFNTALHFDFDASQPHGKLRVEWRRGGESAYLPVPAPAEHYHLRPRGGDIALPPDARLLLPIGKAERGAVLYNNLYGCVACHGDPAVLDSNNIGPHLGRIALDGGTRIEGVSSAQYIYESILEPSAFIAPECEHGRPCQTPTSMPEYSSLVTLEHVADLVTYLLQQTGQEGE